ncbi:peptidase s24-like protein [Fructilactobacillus fructivorans]|nr:peptidase s24-like protein [Fructilactobacillus fructivorans]KRN13680.1 peptidase s24-like protein [Fructilactobacillus fructivorans]
MDQPFQYKGETILTTIERIKRLARMRGWSLQLVAQKAGIGINNIYTWNKKTPSTKSLDKVAKVLGVSIDYLLGNTDKLNYPNDNKDKSKVNEAVDLPILGSIACGKPIFAEQNVTGYFPTLKNDLPSGDNFWLKCDGDSMDPTIKNGAYVLIHYQPEVENGDIAAVLLNDDEDATLKRISTQKDQTVLIPDNKQYPPIILNKDNPGKIIGKAIRMQSEL